MRNKKGWFFSVCFLFIFLFLLTACNGSPATPGADADPIEAEGVSAVSPVLSADDADSIKGSILGSLPADYPLSDLEIKTYSDTGNVRFNFRLTNGSSPTYFGEYVVVARDILSKVYDAPAWFTVIGNTKSGDFMFIFDSKGGEYGDLTDYRSGEAKTITLADDDDLSSHFPALKIYFSESQIDESRLKIYKEVMEAMNDTSKTEEEIFEEMAPNYEMTPDELSSLVRQVMEEIY